MRLKVSYAKKRPFCLALNVLVKQSFILYPYLTSEFFPNTGTKHTCEYDEKYQSKDSTPNYAKDIPTRKSEKKERMKQIKSNQMHNKWYWVHYSALSQWNPDRTYSYRELLIFILGKYKCVLMYPNTINNIVIADVKTFTFETKIQQRTRR